MLLNINTKTRYAEKRRTERLQSFGLDERALQDILFRSLDRLFPEEELILLMQSRNWQEEPDLMAVDKAGHLFTFELKAWESHSANLLQVLRYGQLCGAMKYPELDTWFKKATDPRPSRSRWRTGQSSESSCRKSRSIANRCLSRPASQQDLYPLCGSRTQSTSRSRLLSRFSDSGRLAVLMRMRIARHYSAGEAVHAALQCCAAFASC